MDPRKIQPGELLEALQHRLNTEGERRPAPPRPIDDAQIMELRSLAERYGACPFKKGDVVMARENSYYENSGEHVPVVVVDVPKEPIFERDDSDGGSASPFYGKRLDMRISQLNWDGGKWKPMLFWVESWGFETYVPKPKEEKNVT